ncbi:hypothetical protein I311_06961 [Cryptococcus gattii NT-10]|nr:hypothetical protein I311_06961 [Cryptococcus gattii NT-10]
MSNSTERQANATQQANKKHRSNMAVDVVLPQKSHKKMKLSTTLPSPTSSPDSSSLPNDNTSSTTDRSPSTTHSVFTASRNSTPATSPNGSPVSSPTGSHISIASLSEYPMDGPEPVSLESLYVDNASSNCEEEAGDEGNVEAQDALLQPFTRLSQLPQDRQEAIMASLRPGFKDVDGCRIPSGMQVYPMVIPRSMDFGSVKVVLTYDGKEYAIKIYPRLVHVIKSFNGNLHPHDPNITQTLKERRSTLGAMIDNLRNLDPAELGGFRLEISLNARSLSEAQENTRNLPFLDIKNWLNPIHDQMKPFKLEAMVISKEDLLTIF